VHKYLSIVIFFCWSQCSKAHTALLYLFFRTMRIKKCLQVSSVCTQVKLYGLVSFFLIWSQVNIHTPGPKQRQCRLWFGSGDSPSRLVHIGYTSTTHKQSWTRPNNRPGGLWIWKICGQINPYVNPRLTQPQKDEGDACKACQLDK
jgi:hypothetical protein